MFGWRQANCIENTKENVGRYLMTRTDDELEWEIIDVGLGANGKLLWLAWEHRSKIGGFSLVDVSTLDDEVYLYGPIPNVEDFMKEV